MEVVSDINGRCKIVIFPLAVFRLCVVMGVLAIDVVLVIGWIPLPGPFVVAWIPRGVSQASGSFPADI